MKQNIIFQFIVWYFYEVPKNILSVWKNFLKFSLNYFSVSLLCKTFFTPWRQYQWSYGVGFDAKRYFETIMSNTISRMLGMFIRSILIIIGLLCGTFVFALGLVVLIGWVCLPVILWQGVKINSALIYLLIFFASLQILGSFYNSKLKNALIRKELKKLLTGAEILSSIDFLSYPVSEIILKSIKFRKNQPVDSTILSYFLLKENPKMMFIFHRALLNFKDIKNQLKKEIKNRTITQKDDFEEVIVSSIEIYKKKGHQTIELGDLFIALIKHNPLFEQVLIKNNLYIQDIKNLVWWFEVLKQKEQKRKRFWEYENLIKIGSLGKHWASGYTITLDQYSTDWTSVIKKQGYGEIIGHETEIKEIETTLAGEQNNNVLVIGEPGSGRKSVIYALTKKILFGETLDSLDYKRVVNLDLIGLISQHQTQEEVFALLETIFQEVLRAKNIILIIDKFPNFIASEKETGMININGILSKYIAFPDFRLIGICDFSGFHQYIETNLPLFSLFEKTIINEISEQETILVLEKLLPFYEKKYKKFIPYSVLRDIVNYSAKYFNDFPFPKKAIDLLEETMIYASRYTKTKLVLPYQVARIVAEKTNMPVGKIKAEEKETLLNLEELIHQRIINQNEAVKEISTAMRRSRSNITIRKGPIGAFLFLGPTGVGKTETSKALAEVYFGDKERMIRLDMSEFQTKESIARLIGETGEQGLLTIKIKEKPFSLILLDEIEKAHPDVLNLFLQVIDEGHLTDATGKKISFKNSIIIATSNAGYKIILDALGQKFAWSEVKTKLLDYLFEESIFRPEFINRFDAMVVFKSLTKENLLGIAQLMLNKLKKNLITKHIDLKITDELKERLVELGYNPIFGAREMRRTIQDNVENVLAEALLSGDIKRGDKIKITKEFKIVKIINSQYTSY